MTIIRAFRPADLPALVEIRQAASPLDHGDLPRTLDGIRSEIEVPGLDPAHNLLVAESDDGRVVGMAYILLLHGAEDIFDCRLTVHPDARDGDAGRRLLQAMWDRALARRAECKSQRAWLQTEVSSAAMWLAALLEQNGLSLVRYELQMRCVLAETDVPSLIVPEGVTLRKHRRPHDDRAANAALNEAFRDHWGSVELSDEQFAHFLDCGEIQSDASVIAWAGQEIAGACYNDFSPTRLERLGSSDGYVAVLGVRRPWRKRGIAATMLVWTLREAAARGLEAVSLHVDAENITGAKRLYERVGFREVERFLVYRKCLPG